MWSRKIFRPTPDGPIEKPKRSFNNNNNNKYLFHNIKLHSLNYKKENITIEVQVHIHNEIFLLVFLQTQS